MGRPMTALANHPAVAGADSVELRVARTLFVPGIWSYGHLPLPRDNWTIPGTVYLIPLSIAE